jgi:hypothetical protein
MEQEIDERVLVTTLTKKGGISKISDKVNIRCRYILRYRYLKSDFMVI